MIQLPFAVNKDDLYIQGGGIIQAGKSIILNIFKISTLLWLSNRAG
jgi:hypothetical protein